MKNPFKQMKKVQGAMVEQAYKAYCFGHREKTKGNSLMGLREFCSRIKEVI